MPVESSGNFMRAAVTSLISIADSIQANYVNDAQMASSCASIQTNINNTTIAVLNKDQDNINTIVNNDQKNDDYSELVQQANNQYTNDKNTFSLWSQEATSNQNIVSDDAQRGAQNVQNAMAMISPVLQSLSSFAQLLAS